MHTDTVYILGCLNIVFSVEEVNPTIALCRGERKILIKNTQLCLYMDHAEPETIPMLELILLCTKT